MRRSQIPNTIVSVTKISKLKNGETESNTWQLPSRPGTCQTVQLGTLQVDHDAASDYFSTISLSSLSDCSVLRLGSLVKLLLDKVLLTTSRGGRGGGRVHSLLTSGRLLRYQLHRPPPRERTPLASNVFGRITRLFLGVTGGFQIFTGLCL